MFRLARLCHSSPHQHTSCLGFWQAWLLLLSDKPTSIAKTRSPLYSSSTHRLRHKKWPLTCRWSWSHCQWHYGPFETWSRGPRMWNSRSVTLWPTVWPMKEATCMLSYWVAVCVQPDSESGHTMQAYRYRLQGLGGEITAYFAPRRSRIVSRFKFNSRSQQPGESITSYMSE